MSNQTIHELTNLSEISTNDELPIWDNSAGVTKKVSVEELSLAVNNTVNSYSTEEHATGKKTTDGKDIYSRTFIYRNVTLSTTGTTLENNFPINFINVTKYEGYACRNSSPLSFPVQPYISGTSLACIQAISSTAVDKVEVTIEYTKD